MLEVEDDPMPEVAPELEAPPPVFVLEPDAPVVPEVPASLDVPPSPEEVEAPVLPDVPLAVELVPEAAGDEVSREPLDDEPSEPCAEPEVAPMPDAEPDMEPLADGPVELQAASVIAQVIEISNFFIDPPVD